MKPQFLALIDNGMGECSMRFTLSLLAAVTKFPFEIVHVKDSRLSVARDTAANLFLKSDCEHMLFIDLDMVFTTTQLERLFNSEHDIICGLCFLKDGKNTPCFNTFAHEGKREIVAGQIIEVARAGTGCMRIHRKVFEAMRKTAPRYGADHSDGVYHFFPQGIYEGRYRSEDWGFCDKARELGFKIMVDTGVQIGHEGRVIFPLVTPLPLH